MTQSELRASFGLAGIYGLRMLGLFIILPVFALYAVHLPGGEDKTLVGFALGAYGLTQAALQIPFGRWSDQFGRKRVMYVGLGIFALGSFVAAFASTVHMVIVGRILQGAGAISGAALALMADLTRDQVRAKAMAIVGVSISASFVLSIVLAPVLNGHVGVPGIFAGTGVLALLAMLVLAVLVPNPVLDAAPSVARGARGWGDFVTVLTNRKLWRLNFGIFTLQGVIIALFLAVPFALQDAKVAVEDQWKVYLPVMLASIAIMAPVVMIGGRGDRLNASLLGSIGALLIALMMLTAAGVQLAWLVVGLTLFFAAFNVLEASVPALISREAPAHAKGTALGVYTTVQFLGPAFAGPLAGYLYQHVGRSSVFVFCALLTLVWLILAVSAGRGGFDVKKFRLPALAETDATRLADALARVRGVREAMVDAAAKIATLKVETGFDEQGVLRLIEEG